MRPDPAAPPIEQLRGRLDATTRLDVYTAKVARIANLAATAPTAPVPTCPDWTTADLARHVQRILQWCTVAMTRPDDAPPGRLGGEKPDDASAARALLDQATATADALRDLPEDLAVWTWAWGRAPAVFWHRRLVHEVVVHAVDAELAVGLEPTAIAPAVAVDGIDELLRTHTQVRAGEPGFVLAEGEAPDDLHVHVTDADDGEWLVTRTTDGADVTLGHTKARVAVRGTGHDVLLALWGRSDWSTTTWFGDDADVAAWQARLAGVAT